MVITDRRTDGGRSIDDVAAAVLEAGVRAVQLRDKDASASQLLEQARLLRDLTARFGALLFVNDRLDVAIAADADGAHLGPDDVPVAAARRAVPKGFLLGYSTDDPDLAKQAQADGADYLGCGTVFPTSSKADAGEVIGLDGLAAVVGAVEIPVLGIGGITAERAREIRGTGAAGVAVISCVMAASDPEDAARDLLKSVAEGVSGCGREVWPDGSRTAGAGVARFACGGRRGRGSGALGQSRPAGLPQPRPVPSGA